MEQGGQYLPIWSKYESLREWSGTEIRSRLKGATAILQKEPFKKIFVPKPRKFLSAPIVAYWADKQLRHKNWCFPPSIQTVDRKLGKK